MSVYVIPDTPPIEVTNPDWTSDFLDAMYVMQQGRGSRFGYGEKEGLWMLFTAGASLGGAAFTVIADSDSITLQSSLLVGVPVAAIGMDGTLRPPADGGVDIWRKGEDGDTDEEQTASDSITLLNGSSFFNGQAVTIIKGA